MTYENKHPSFFQQPQPTSVEKVEKKPTVEKFEVASTTSARKILRGAQEPSRFSKLFFSAKNIENIQKSIRFAVYTKTKDVIHTQSYTELSIVMKSTYLQYGRVPAETKNYPLRIQELNERVINLVVPTIITGVYQYKGYLIDAAKPPSFLDRPVNDSSVGTKDNRSTNDVLFGN